MSVLKRSARVFGLGFGGRINLVRGCSTTSSLCSAASEVAAGLCCRSHRIGTEQTRKGGHMDTPDAGDDAPDATGIDLGQVCDRASLVYVLKQLKFKAGAPAYTQINDLSRGKLPRSTLSNLIGHNAQDRSSDVTWDTVKTFICALAPLVPGINLSRWKEAWERAMRPGRPVWQEEQERLRDRIDQLTAALAASEDRIDQLAVDVQKAEARAREFEKALAGRDQTQSAEPPLSESDLKALYLKAAARYDVMDYAGAAGLYEKIAERLKNTDGPNKRRTLEAQGWRLEAKTCEYGKSFTSSFKDVPLELRPRPYIGEDLRRSWQELICEYQRWLPEGDRMILEFRLRHAYWADTLWSHDLARRILSDLHVDCKLFLPPDDTFTAQVVQRMKNGFRVT